MKKIISAILSVTAFAAVVLGVFYAIDRKRMKNNEPVLFSAWRAKAEHPHTKAE